MRVLMYLLILLLFACSNSPQPISYGKDECSDCKMSIIDKKFGAELISVKGKIYKFDDISCMVQFLISDKIEQSEIEKILVINYQQEEEFLDAKIATYFMSEDLHSPMGGNTAAFKTKNEVESFKGNKVGTFLTWKEVSIKLN